MLRICSLLLVALLIASPAVAETYHVASDGSDGADGSAEKPWRTIQRAVAMVGVGDVVLVGAGEYAGFTLEGIHGTSDAPVVFRGQANARIVSPGEKPDDPLLNTALRNYEWPSWPHGISVQDGSHIVIEGFEVIGMPGEEFDGDQRISRGGAGILLSDCHHVTLRNNRARDNGRWGIFASFCDDLLVEGNEASGSKLEHGLYLSNSGDRNVIRGNRLFANRLAGLHLNSDNNFHSDVYATRATVDGVSKNLLVEQNIIHDNGVGGGSGINCDGIQDSIIQNNLLYNNHATGIALFQIDGYDGARRNTIVNNTIVNAADSRWAIRLVGCEDVRGETCLSASAPFLPDWERPEAIAGGATGTVIYNNIVYNHGSSGAIYVDTASLLVDPVSKKGLASNSNRMEPRFWVDGATHDLAGWRSTTGQDAASQGADPEVLFRDIGANDYTLANGSTAIDAADPTYAPMVDVVGQRRPIGEGPDIGAYEYCDGDECEPAGDLDAGPESPSTNDAGSTASDAAGSTDKKPNVGGGCCTCETGRASSGSLVVVLLLLTWVLRRAIRNE